MSHAGPLRLALLLTSLLVAPQAFASARSCIGAADGAPCGSDCVLAGRCAAGHCVASAIAADGSACVSDDHCTEHDTCQAGVCIAGAPLACPDQGDCLRGACDPTFGCRLQNVCAAAAPPPHEDAHRAIDLPDGGDEDAGGPSTAGTELTGDGIPRPGSVGDSGPAGSGTLSTHVHGASLAAGCSLAPAPHGNPAALMLLLLVALAGVRHIVAPRK